MISEALEQSSQIAFRQIANLESIEIEPSSLDGVLCISVLEYLNDPSATLRKLATGLRAGGSLIVSVPNRSSLLRKGLGGAFQVTNKLAGEGWPPYFEFSRHEYSASDFADLLNACNLRIEKQLFLGGPLPEAFQRSPVLGPLIMFKARKAA